MQLQMKVCDLEECDFLETKFVEYVDRNAFGEDTNEDIYEDDNGLEFNNICLSKDNKKKGIILYFHTKDGKPHYVYKPLDIIHPDDIIQWEEKMLDLYQSDKYNYTYIKFIYWKLEEVSCVLVCRNRQWFEGAIQQLKELWDIVISERVSGFEHRAPNRKTKKDVTKYNVFDMMVKASSNNSGCLLQVKKLDFTLDIDVNVNNEN